MSETKSFSVKFNEAQREYSNEVLSKAKELFGTTTKGESLFKIIEQWDERLLAEGDPLQDGVSTIPDNLEDLCALENLQKIVDPKDGIRKWFCLKNQDPDKKGKPILMADGKDRKSIQLLCKQCGLNFAWREQRSKEGKAMLIWKNYAESEFSIPHDSCIHPAFEGTQVNIGGYGAYYCMLKQDRVTLERTCIPTNCEHLSRDVITIKMKDTVAYKELQKQLEELK